MKTLGSEIDEANRKTCDRIISAEAVLVDMMPARKAIPGFAELKVVNIGISNFADDPPSQNVEVPMCTCTGSLQRTGTSRC